MDMFQIIALFAGLLVIISSLPQLFVLYKHKRAKDVSLPMFLILFTANILWFIYGVHLADSALIFTNLFAGFIALANIILIVKYRYGQK